LANQQFDFQTMSLRKITKEEFQKHTEDDDQQWIEIEGRVIDVTKFKVNLNLVLIVQ
jgi:cytochrome b involved in lipid metabolism